MSRRFALALTTLALLSGCGSAPGFTPAQAALGNRVAAAGVTHSHMEQEYSYRLSSKAAKAFLAAAADKQKAFKADGTTCSLKEKGGFFGTTIEVKLEGTLEGVLAAREALDALYKSLK